MIKFRNHKNRIISSKRDSQKVDSLQLLQFSQLYSLGRINTRIGQALKHQLHSITQDHYKIGVHFEQKQSEKNNLEGGNIGEDMQGLKTIRSVKSQDENDYRSSQKTFKKENQAHKNPKQSQVLGKILDIMTTINLLQQKLSTQKKQESPLTTQINDKISQFKQLIGSIQDSRSRILDFYNQQSSNKSPSSFNSGNRDQQFNQNTDRQAYQMMQNKSLEGDLQIKYRRIDRVHSTEQDDNNTFIDQQQLSGEQQSGEQLSGEQEGSDVDLLDCQTDHNYSTGHNENSIIHLFSYQKQKCIESALSSITQRQSQYQSHDSKNMTLNLNHPHFSDNSLQYKKIQYLLQSSGKKKDKQTTTSPHLISQFTIDNKTSRSNISNNKSIHIRSDVRDRNRCHSQLMDMINLLQTKYKRKVTSSSHENMLESISATVSSRLIKSRGRK